MHTVYVLRSLKDGNLYIGCTSNIQKRLAEHNSGRVRSTKSRTPFELTHTEVYESKYEAFGKERYYKSAKGKKDLLSKIK